MFKKFRIISLILSVTTLTFSCSHGAETIPENMDGEQLETKRMMAQVKDLNIKIDQLEAMLTTVENKLFGPTTEKSKTDASTEKS